MKRTKAMDTSCQCEGVDPRKFARRSFLQKGLCALAGVTGCAGVLAALRFLAPNVLYEPPRKKKIGRLEEIQTGCSFVKEAKIFLFKTGQKDGRVNLHAISASCTHLGCTIQHTPGLEHDGAEVGFTCACHGSQYSMNGNVLKGPAPRDLPWFHLEFAPDDGQLVVDTGKILKNRTALSV